MSNANSPVKEKIRWTGWRNLKKLSRTKNIYHAGLINDCKYFVIQMVKNLSTDWLINLLILINPSLYISKEMRICFLNWKMETQWPFSSQWTTDYFIEECRIVAKNPCDLQYSKLTQPWHILYFPNMLSISPINFYFFKQSAIYYFLF